MKLRALVCAASILLVACGASAPGPESARGGIVVASFDFAESHLLAEIYSTALERAGYPVNRMLDLGPREIVQPALRQDRIDLVPEYLGAAVDFATLGRARVTANPASMRHKLQDALGDGEIIVLDYARAQDQNGFAVTRETAERLGVSTLSDLAPEAGTLIFGGPPECPERFFCLRGLESVYGIDFKSFEAIDAGGPGTVAALRAGEIDVGLLFTTDPSIKEHSFVLLKDDRRLQPADNVVPVARTEVLARYGDGVVRTLNAVTNNLTTRTLRELNVKIADGAGFGIVASEWLDEGGI